LLSGLKWLIAWMTTSLASFIMGIISCQDPVKLPSRVVIHQSGVSPLIVHVL
jgi:hypothetical protein